MFTRPSGLVYVRPVKEQRDRCARTRHGRCGLGVPGQLLLLLPLNY